MSIHCDEVAEYSPERSAAKNAEASITQSEEHNINNKSLTTNGTRNNYENNSFRSSTIEEQQKERSDIKLWIHIEESNNPMEDEQKLRDIVRLLLNHKGDSPTALVIKTNGKTVKGDLPFARISYCEQLHSELAELVGNDSITIETD